MFIYIVTNDVNHKSYVGLHSGSGLRKRWKNHLSAALAGEGSILYNAIRKYGPANFHVTAVWSGHISPEKLKMLERYYIRCFQTMSPNGYNLTDGGDGSFGFKHSEEYKQSMRGRIVADSTRQKMSLFHKGKTISTQQRQVVAEKLRGNKHLLGHVHSAETRAKISAAGKGRIKSEETCAKFSRVLKERGIKPPGTTGFVFSKESREKMSASHKGFRHSEESKRKMSETKRTPEMRNKASEKTKKYYAEKRNKIQRGELPAA